VSWIWACWAYEHRQCPRYARSSGILRARRWDAPRPPPDSSLICAPHRILHANCRRDPLEEASICLIRQRAETRGARVDRRGRAATRRRRADTGGEHWEPLHLGPPRTRHCCRERPCALGVAKDTSPSLGGHHCTWAPPRTCCRHRERPPCSVPARTCCLCRKAAPAPGPAKDASPVLGAPPRA